MPAPHTTLSFGSSSSPTDATLLTVVNPSDKDPQSGMGITSCIVATIALFSVVMMTIVILAMHKSNLTPQEESSPFNYMIGGWFFGTGVASLTGIVFGIGGLLQKQRRRECAVIGLIANVLIPIGLMASLVAATTFERSTNTRLQEPVEIDPNGWHSDSTKVLGLMMLILASFLVIRVVIKRRIRTGKVPQSACNRCRKIIPSTSRFCRRCGSPHHCQRAIHAL